MRDLTDGPVTSPVAATGAERRAAAVTCADKAIAGGWENELADVLDAVGLRGDQ